MRKRNVGYAAAALLSIALLVPAFSSAQKSATGANGIRDGREKCYGCHSQVKSLKEGSKHAALACETCHSGTGEHLQSFRNKPVTAIDHAVCGKCHSDQFDSFMKVSHHAQARKEKGVPTGRSPLQEKLLVKPTFLSVDPAMAQSDIQCLRIIDRRDTGVLLRDLQPQALAAGMGGQP